MRFFQLQSLLLLITLHMLPTLQLSSNKSNRIILLRETIRLRKKKLLRTSNNCRDFSSVKHIHKHLDLDAVIKIAVVICIAYEFAANIFIMIFSIVHMHLYTVIKYGD